MAQMRYAQEEKKKSYITRYEDISERKDASTALAGGLVKELRKGGE
jgi:hypothetical protein